VTELEENRLLSVGARLPEFEVEDDSGATISSTSFLGKPLVLYFYPKDDTPGCTNEAGQFRDLYEKFKKKGVQLVGVSRDSAVSHQKFKKKYDLPFPLLADVDEKLSTAFRVLVEKNMYGKKSMGIQRSTFLFDAEGELIKVWPKVSVEGHAEEILAELG
jgi:peroxiredoxin Q/BCP